MVLSTVKSLYPDNIEFKQGTCLERRGRKQTKLQTRKVVWDFWHKMSQETSDTQRPAKLRVTNRSRLQSDLTFPPSVKISTQHNRDFFESMWRITYHTYQALHKKFLIKHPEDKVSYGTFLSLKPFFVRPITTRDVEVCCCKQHLHARRMVLSLINLLTKYSLQPAEFNDYYSYFSYLTADCPKEEHTHISWSCTREKKTLCQHITSQWQHIVDRLWVFFNTDDSDSEITVRFEYF